MSAAPSLRLSPRAGRWCRAAAAGGAGGAGAITLLVQLPSTPFEWTPLAHAPFRHLLGVAGGVGLLWLARGLAEGRRRAADVAVAALCLLAGVRLGTGLGLVDSGLELAIAGALFGGRHAFPRGGAAPLAGVAAGTVAFGATAGAYALYASDRISGAGMTDVDIAVSHTGPALLHGAWWVAPSGLRPLALDALVAVGLLAAAVFLRALLRPRPARVGHLPEDHVRAADIVERHGSDSLDPFALREDKAFHFSGDGFVAYRVIGTTAVVSGDPIGPEGAAPRILSSFLGHVDAQGWDVVLTAASHRHLASYRALGLRSLKIGEEAVIDPLDFTLEGRKIRKVRQSVTRLARQGWRVELVEGRRLTPDVAAEIDRVERRWRSGQPRLQGFAMTLGRLWGAEEDAASLYVVARDLGGELRSFLRFAVLSDSLSLDVMRRSGGEPNGLSEALVAAALTEARARELREVSLNFAGFAHVMGADRALDRPQRALRWLLQRGHGRFQLERLICFNDKFGPRWQPRYLVYRSRTRLPLSALRVMQAEAYVRAPRVHPVPARWRPVREPITTGARLA